MTFYGIIRQRAITYAWSFYVEEALLVITIAALALCCAFIGSGAACAEQALSKEL